MAGEARLEGAVADQARHYLKVITDVLDKLNIRYCLDGGTLLGIAREGRLLPWDNDMDLFIDGRDVHRLLKSRWRLWLKGLRVRSDTFSANHGPLKQGQIRIVRFRNRKGLWSRGSVLLDAIVKYADEQDFYWSVGTKPAVYKKVPRHFYDNFGSIEFDGKTYPAPLELDAYLTCRYGDWKTPVTEWNYLTDDQALIKR